MQLTKPLDTSNADSDSELDLSCCEEDLQNAITSNPRGAIWILGSHLSIDFDALHDRVVQLEFQQRKGMAAKRLMEGENSSERRQLRKMLVKRAEPFYPEWRLSDDRESEQKHTLLKWEANSENFREKTAHLKLRDMPPGERECSERGREQGSTYAINSPTEK